MKIKSMEIISENAVLSAVKASIKMEKYLKRRGTNDAHRASIKYAISTIASVGVEPKKAIELLESLTERSEEIIKELKQR
jgi:hypothetical protein